MNKFLGSIVLALLLIQLSACNSTNESAASTQVQSAEELSQLDSIHLIITSNDMMRFDKNELVAWEGQTVTITLKHTGTMPKTAMGHNFVLIDNSISVADYCKKALEAKDNEYIPSDTNLTIAHTALIGGGEQTQVTFKAPSKGTYDFLCSFPGHYSVMKGKFIVQ